MRATRFRNFRFSRPFFAGACALVLATWPALVRGAEESAAAQGAPAAAGTLAPAAAAEPLALPLDGREGRELLLRNFRPEPMLRVPAHPLTRAKFPVVDIHTHFGLRLKGSPEALDDFVGLMDRNRIAVCVSLDAELGPRLDDHLNFVRAKHARRFVVFATPNFRGQGQENDPATWDCQAPDFPRRLASHLEQAQKQGISGLKIHKQFGLSVPGSGGRPAQIDDERWDCLWETCGRLGLPVLMHTADPAAFFRPIDEKNERWEELSRRPEWSFAGAQFPPREELLAARNRVIEKFPRTVFIGAHVANSSEDLATASAWLDKYPNLYLDIASRIGELGRQPYSARAFFLKYANRILLGTDGPWPEARVVLYWRFLETYDEYFPYAENEFPPQGLWRIYGIGLPDEVLRKVYFENAARLIPGVKERLAEFEARQP